MATDLQNLTSAQSQIVNKIITIGHERGYDAEVISAAVSIANAESTLNPNAANPTSTAKGLFQYIDSAWTTAWNRFTRDHPDDPLAQLSESQARNNVDAHISAAYNEFGIYYDGYPAVINPAWQDEVDTLVSEGYHPDTDFLQYAYLRHNTNLEQVREVYDRDFTTKNVNDAEKLVEQTLDHLDNPPALDLVFAIDTSGSMGNNINAVKAQAGAVIDKIFSNEDSRVGIVDFNDVGSIHTILNMTSDKTAVQNGINSVAIRGGGAEPTNQAVLNILNDSAGVWRGNADVERRIIVFSDEPPADPEKAGDVARKSQEVNAVIENVDLPPGEDESPQFVPLVTQRTMLQSAMTEEGEIVQVSVDIFTVVIGNSASALAALTAMAENNRGQVFTAANASEVVAALLGAITAPPTDTNDAPVIASAIADVITNEDVVFTLDISGNFSDPDAGDTLTYTAAKEDGSALPDWLAFDAATGIFSGTPANGDVGAVSVTVTATDDDGESVSDTFDLTVNNVNDAPELVAALPDKTANRAQAFSFVVPLATFTDVDAGDHLTYSATLADGSTLPGWLTFNAATRTFSGTPQALDNGIVQVKVTATDTAGASASDTFALAVNLNPTKTGTNGNDNITTGNQTVDIVAALGGNDTVYLRDKNDFADGGAGNDKLIGETGNDTLVGGEGNDTLDGVDDNDLLFGGNGADSLIGGNGLDTLYGDTGNDTLDGGDGTDYISGGDGNDKLIGANGLDTLDGGAGNDTLEGGDGNDVLIGGLGADRMSAANGYDKFVFNTLADSTVAARDVILDFARGQDKLDLSALDIGYSDITITHTGSGSSAHTFVAISGTSFSVDLTGNLALNASDFIF